MTIEQGKQKVVDTARAEVGYHEGANNYTKYADDPNVIKLYGSSKQNLAWCGTFANWVYMKAFGYSIGSRLTYGGSAACANAAQLYKNNGAFVRTPQLADQAFYYASGGINHTGIVVDIQDRAFYAVEGNYSDKVSIVRRNIYGSDVAGFGRPNWSIVSNESLNTVPNTDSSLKNDADSLKTEDHSLILPVLRYGSKGVTVALAQSALTVRGFTCGEIDGEFGPLTQAAVNRFQTWAKISVDGVCGKDTWTALLKWEE